MAVAGVGGSGLAVVGAGKEGRPGAEAEHHWWPAGGGGSADYRTGARDEGGGGA